MPLNSGRRCFDQLSWPQVEQAVARPGSTLVWPFGACEQHGPHLPLATDALFADRLLDAVLRQLPADCPIWRLPVQAIGFSPEHSAFPGTLSLAPDLLIALVVQVGEQLAAMGWTRLVLFNAHGGQIALLQVAARQLRVRCPQMAVLPCFLWSGVDGLSGLISEAELEQGLHAAEAETSLMLRLAPELVGPERPVDGLPPAAPGDWSLEGAAPCAWLARDLSASGVIGDSRLASVELGGRLEERLVEHWLRQFKALLASDWPPLNAASTGVSGS